jgi:nucleoside-diphosphate-sugar epimerase
MKITVIGGTGLIGSASVANLSPRGRAVISMSGSAAPEFGSQKSRYSRATSPSYWLPHLDEAVVADTLVSDRATLPEYVQQRRKLHLPLFYEPRRTPCGDNANPQWQSLRITSVRPNHGGRYRFDR